MSNSELAGNTLLLSSEDGQQQCVYVTTGEEGEEGTILTLDSAYADAVAQLGTDQVIFIVWPFGLLAIVWFIFGQWLFCVLQHFCQDIKYSILVYPPSQS